MFLGVPLVAFLSITGVFLLIGVWGFYLVSPYLTLALLLLYIPLVLLMRYMTRLDDQRLRQLWLRTRVRGPQANHDVWGAVSFSPLRYKRRHTGWRPLEWLVCTRR